MRREGLKFGEVIVVNPQKVGTSLDSLLFFFFFDWDREKLRTLDDDFLDGKFSSALADHFPFG